MSSFDLIKESYWGGRPIARQIAEVRPRSRVVVTGTVRTTETVTVGRSASYRVVLRDDTGELDLLFLGRSTVAGIGVGTRCSVEGTAQLRGGRLVVWNPLYKLEPADRIRGVNPNGQLPEREGHAELTTSLGSDETEHTGSSVDRRW
jgi:RecG-like helicase